MKKQNLLENYDPTHSINTQSKLLKNMDDTTILINDAIKSLTDNKYNWIPNKEGLLYNFVRHYKVTDIENYYSHGQGD